MNNLFKISNTEYLNPPNEYNFIETYPTFQNKLNQFKLNLKKNLKTNNYVTYYKFGDGDYYFLIKITTGSAKPGIRALKKTYDKLDLEPFINGFRLNDNFACLITKNNITKFNEMIPAGPNYPSEII